ncbi:MAG: hypothetical protein Q8M83_02990 [bacterium]|nr:hypothetical protein [bacterium]
MEFTVEQLFGSKVRLRLLRLFLENPEGKFYIREITRLIKAHIHSVRREISNLRRLGLIAAKEDDGSEAQTNRRYFEVNQKFLLFTELRNLILKSQVVLQADFARALQTKGEIAYLAFTGSFVSNSESPTDLFIVGKLARDECRKMVKFMEDELGRAINYTLMTPHEYEQRKKLTDRFIYQILENNKIVLIDHLNNSRVIV